MHRKNLERFCRWMMRRIRRLQPDRNWTRLSLVLTDDPTMAEVNFNCFQKKEPTDVISFAYDPLPGESGAAGEVIVNVECALREGPRHDGASRELAFYIAHGCHHLAGATDTSDAERKAMHAAERRWLRQAAHEGILGPGLLVDEPSALNPA